LFREDDGIVVPRVYPQYTTPRVLTMERLDGVHVDELVARSPSQHKRNQFAARILHAWYPMLYAGRFSYADLHPGNFLFMGDGRPGVIDRIDVRPIAEEEVKAAGWDRSDYA
jgi:predicted unusual protein kinase regulating ubiquinone biosynthesis (AarF/ABC1/UbiB family)